VVEPDRAVEEAILRVQMQVREVHRRIWRGGNSLSSRAWTVKRKSINRFSTALVCAVAFAALGGGCAGEGPASAPSDLLVTADPSTVALSPGKTGRVRFLLTSEGVPIPDQKVTFAIVEAGTNASLAGSGAVSDADGFAFANVQAGIEETFHVRATTEGMTQADALVVVGPVGSVVVAPFFAPSSSSAPRVSQIDVLVFDGYRCEDTLPTGSPGPGRDKPLSASGGTVEFDDVRTDETSAAVAHAIDRQSVTVAAGCVDLSGSSLLPNGVVQVALPLYDTVTTPVGSFNVTSKLVFSPPLAAAGAIAAPWHDLANCPLDPAQLWLDCTIDALLPATAEDPLDCVPLATPGAKGPVGDALSARRGMPIANADGTPSGCRGGRDAGGDVSLDATLLGLFGSPLPPEVVALQAVAYDAAHILDRLTLQSTLDVSAGDRPDRFVVAHTLLSAEFPTLTSAGSVGAAIKLPYDLLQPLGLPVLSAYATATTEDQQIFIANHGFTLRLGTVARAAFGVLALAPRGLPANPGDVPVFLAGLAHLDDGVTYDCAAMDQALCPRAGLGAGCLIAACADGLAVLAAQLDASFDPADGPGLDLHLTGSAPLLDQTGVGTTRVLGSTEDKVAAWSVDLRTRLGRSTLGATLDGFRN
jgi:hypothetical protein